METSVRNMVYCSVLFGVHSQPQGLGPLLIRHLNCNVNMCLCSFVSNSAAPGVLQLDWPFVLFFSLFFLLASLAHAMTFSSDALPFDYGFWLCGRAQPLRHYTLGV